MRQLASVMILASGLIAVVDVTSISAVSAQSASANALDPAVVAQIAETYRACVAFELTHVDTNANGKLDSTEDVDFFADGEAFCQEELQAEMAHAARLAQLDQDMDAAHAQIEATTADIISGAKQQLVL